MFERPSYGFPGQGVERIGDDTTNATLLRSEDRSTKDFTRSMASIVLRPSRKPNWASQRSGPTRDRCPTRRATNIRLNSLPALSSRQIDRYAEGESAGFPSFERSTSSPPSNPGGDYRTSGSWQIAA